MDTATFAPANAQRRRWARAVQRYCAAAATDSENVTEAGTAVGVLPSDCAAAALLRGEAELGASPAATDRVSEAEWRSQLHTVPLLPTYPVPARREPEGDITPPAVGAGNASDLNPDTAADTQPDARTAPVSPLNDDNVRADRRAPAEAAAAAVVAARDVTAAEGAADALAAALLTLARTCPDNPDHDTNDGGAVTLLSVFKWERRKGWDVLLDAYTAAFVAEPLHALARAADALGSGAAISAAECAGVAPLLAAEPPTLLLRTTPPRVAHAPRSAARTARRAGAGHYYNHGHGDDDDDDDGGMFVAEHIAATPAFVDAVTLLMDTLARARTLRASHAVAENNTATVAAVARAGLALPRVSVLSAPLSQRALPSLYRAATALVQPSRGEGWGRPHAEAMAAGLPVLATAWGGVTAFLTAATGRPVAAAGFERVGEGAFAGHWWARPSAVALAAAMRAVAAAPLAAALRGAAARRSMRDEFCEPCVARLAAAELRRATAPRERVRAVFERQVAEVALVETEAAKAEVRQ